MGDAATAATAAPALLNALLSAGLLATARLKPPFSQADMAAARRGRQQLVGTLQGKPIGWVDASATAQRPRSRAANARDAARLMRGARPKAPAVVVSEAAAALPACIRAHASGATLAVHAKPGARLAALVAVGAVAEVAIDAPAREGEANDALAAFLAAALGLKKRDVALVSGGKSRDKVFHVQLPPAELAVRLLSALQ